MKPREANSEEGSLERFAKNLNRSGRSESGLRSTRLSRAGDPAKTVARDWSELEAAPKAAPAKPGRNWLVRIFLWSLTFFLATAAVTVYVLFFSSSLVSSDNIDLSITGPTLLRSGDELTLEISTRNRNKVMLRDVSLAVTYPPGTTDSLASGRELTLWRENLPDLRIGQTATVVSRAIVFGAQNSKQTINVVLEYQIPDSNAVFTKEVSYVVEIGSSPLELSLQVPGQINAGKSFTANLKVVSNAQTLLRQVTVRIEYPEGFLWRSSDPAPIRDDNAWFLGDLSPGSTREINLTGVLSGQSEEFKSFKVSAGLDRAESGRSIDVEYGNLFKTVSLKRDFVSAVIDLGGVTTVAAAGNLSGWINWRNNLSDRVINATLRLYLDGAVIDKRSVKASAGFYDSLTNSIYWDKNLLPELGLLNPEATGRTGFNFSVLPAGSWSDNTSTDIRLRLVLEGVRITAEDAGEEIFTEAEQLVKGGTEVELAAKGEHTVGPFSNTGPLPPEVGEETTYTITWSVANSLNPVNGATVRTVLPPYVKWLSVVSPLDEKVIYHNTDQEVVWALGAVSPATGSGRQVSFQVALVPSLSQVGQAVNLTGPLVFEGVDTVTGQKINLTRPAVTTNLATDPGFSFGQSEVVE